MDEIKFNELIKKICTNEIIELEIQNELTTDYQYAMIISCVDNDKNIHKIVLKADEIISNKQLGYIIYNLRENKSINKLILKNLDINFFHSKMLEKALGINKTIKYLDLSSNYAGEHLAESLANILKHNQTIETLDVSYNRFGNAGLRSIANSLKQNKTLKELKVYSNLKDATTEKLFIKIIENNLTLQKFEYFDPRIMESKKKIPPFSSLLEVFNKFLVRNKLFEKFNDSSSAHKLLLSETYETKPLVQEASTLGEVTDSTSHF